MKPTALIDDRNQFIAFMAAQPLCQWCAQKQRDFASGKLSLHDGGPISTAAAKPKNDNADLAAALASMA